MKCRETANHSAIPSCYFNMQRTFPFPLPAHTVSRKTLILLSASIQHAIGRDIREPQANHLTFCGKKVCALVIEDEIGVKHKHRYTHLL